MKLLISLILCCSFLAVAEASSISCNKVLLGSSSFQQMTKDLVSADLYKIQSRDSHRLSAEEIQTRNKQLIKDMSEMPIEGYSIKDINKPHANLLLSKLKDHEVAGNQKDYERDDVELGYCFGRATCAHMLALKDGYKKDQIKKVWAVGSMKTGSIEWGYHVSLIVRGKSGRWWAIDTITGKPVTLENWYAEMMTYSTDGELEFFVTNPEKFGPGPGKYSRTDLGLGLTKDKDYYRGYFIDMMPTFKAGRTPKKKPIFNFIPW